MKLLLYDKAPERHGINVAELESSGLTHHHPNKGLPQLKGVDVVLIHVTNDSNDDLARQAISAQIPVVLFSGDFDNVFTRAQKLRLEHPASHICAIHQSDLKVGLPAALQQEDAERLCQDKLSDALEFLSPLWDVYLKWEKNALESTHLTAEGYFDLGSLAEVSVENGEKLNDIYSRIYQRPKPPLPDPSQVLRVSDSTAFLQALKQMRDSLLAWAGTDA